MDANGRKFGRGTTASDRMRKISRTPDGRQSPPDTFADNYGLPSNEGRKARRRSTEDKIKLPSPPYFGFLAGVAKPLKQRRRTSYP